MPRPRRFKPIYKATNQNHGKPVTFTHTIPDGFVLVIDTREQTPLFIPPPKDLVIKRDTLSSGDYSVSGFEDAISIERKSIEDLFGSLGHDRDRFRAELERLVSYQFKALVIEGSEQDVLCHQEFSRMHPNAVRWSIVAIQQKYCPGIQVHYEPDRSHLERWVLDHLLYFYNLKRGQ